MVFTPGTSPGKTGDVFEEEYYGYGTLLFLRISETIIHKEQRFVYTRRAVGIRSTDSGLSRIG
jgi:hypothetical protein